MMLNEMGEIDPPDEVDFEGKWNDPQHQQGLLRLSNFGCGIFANLIVNGPEYGHIWIDDRSSEAGIYPFSKTDDFSDRVGFLDWYELWLDQSLNNLKTSKS
jgi:hypothetical protein